MTTIEKLRVKSSLSEQKQQVWQTIPASNMTHEFTPRVSSVAYPITSTQILIMGGTKNEIMQNEVMQNDVFLLDIEVDQVVKVAQGGAIRF